MIQWTMQLLCLTNVQHLDQHCSLSSAAVKAVPEKYDRRASELVAFEM